MSCWEGVQKAVKALERRMGNPPEVAIILGSGLGGLSQEVVDAQRIPYVQIPGFPWMVAAGHVGELVMGRLGGKEVALLSGRPHYYQGYSPAELTIPTRAMAALGCRVLLVTNAAGALDLTFRPGQMMLISDHIDLLGLAGHHALRGGVGGDSDSRFVAMAEAYDAELRALARRVAAELGLPLREGVYVMVSGPTYETPAEVAFLRALGAQAVGMSTVPEVIAARQEGLRVLGISHITNLAGGVVSHQEVLQAGEKLERRFTALVTGILKAL